jgi:hypothetical protein
MVNPLVFFLREIIAQVCNQFHKKMLLTILLYTNFKERSKILQFPSDWSKIGQAILIKFFTTFKRTKLILIFDFNIMIHNIDVKILHCKYYM